MGRNRQVEAVAQGGDALAFRQAGAGDVRHGHIESSQRNPVAPLPDGTQPLTCRHLHRQGAGHLGLAADILRLAGRFQPAHAERLQPPPQLDCRGDIARSVNIHHQLGLRPHCPPHRFHDCQQLRIGHAQVQFERAVAGRQQFPGVGRDRVRALAAQTGVDRHIRAKGAAQKFVYRLAQSFAQQIVEGQIDGRQRVHIETGHVPALPHGAVQAIPEILHVERIFAEQQGRTQIIDDCGSGSRRDRSLTFPPADQPVVGLQAHEAGLMVAGVDRRPGVDGDRVVAKCLDRAFAFVRVGPGGGNFQGIGLDRYDPHKSLRLWWVADTQICA